MFVIFLGGIVAAMLWGLYAFLYPSSTTTV